MAKNAVRYSKLFKTKVFLNALMCLVCFLYMLLVFMTPKKVNISSWINQCDREPYALLYIVQCLAWGFAAYLLLQEYERGLSEAVYACQLFWSLNLTVEFVICILLYDDILSSGFMLATAIFNVSVNFTLVILMLNTKKRTLYNRRLNVHEEYLLANETA